MVFFNYALRKLNAKIVYYGPGLCGKTTNLQWIHDHFEGGQRGKMISLATEGDRTIFFDLLPLDIGKIRGMDVTLQLYTVPGQVHYNTTRQLVLKGADGVVFVADSQRAMLKSNVESLHNLRENLRLQGIELRSFPHVFQFNKRDLRDIAAAEELDAALNEFRVPIFDAIATEGIGVQDTLEGIVKLVMRSLRERYEAAAGAPVTTHPVEQPPAAGPSVLQQMPVVLPGAGQSQPMRASRSVAPPPTPEPPAAAASGRSADGSFAFPGEDDSDPSAITHPGEDLTGSPYPGEGGPDPDHQETDIFADPTADVEPSPEPVLEVEPDEPTDVSDFDSFFDEVEEEPAEEPAAAAPVEPLSYEPPTEDEFDAVEELTDALEAPVEALEFEAAPDRTSPLSTEDVAAAAEQARVDEAEAAWSDEEMVSAEGLGEAAPAPAPRRERVEALEGFEADFAGMVENGVTETWPPPPTMPGERPGAAPASRSAFVVGEGDPFGGPPFRMPAEREDREVEAEVMAPEPSRPAGARVTGVEVIPSDNQLQLRLEGTGALAESGQVRELEIRVPVPGTWVGHRRVTLQLRLTLEPAPEESE